MRFSWRRLWHQSPSIRRRSVSSLRDAEILDARILLSATANVSGGVLTVTLTGDAQGENQLTFESVNGGTAIRLTGGNGTLINGNNATLDFGGVASIRVTGGTTSDAIYLGSNQNPLTIQHVTLNLGDGDNMVVLRDAIVTGNVSITTGAGNDIVEIASNSAFGSTSVTTLERAVVINTGNGNDTVRLRASAGFWNSFGATTFNGTVAINTGGGEDSVQLSGEAGFDSSYGLLTFNRAVTINTGNDDDSVSIIASSGFDSSRGEIVINAPLSVLSGNGDDLVQIYANAAFGSTADVQITGAVNINTGNHNDEVQIGSNNELPVTLNRLNLLTGAGDDSVMLFGVQQTGSGSNTINTGAGIDAVTVRGSTFAAATSLNLGAGYRKVLSIDDSTFQRATSITSKGRLDEISIETLFLGGATQFGGNVSLVLGANARVRLGMNNNSSNTSFLGSFAVTGLTPLGVVEVFENRVSFASPPVLKKIRYQALA